MRHTENNQLIELTIDSLGFEGVAVGRVNEVVHFVKGALPHERVEARITGRKRRFVEAEVVNILEASPKRISAPCQHFGVCGGCTYQHISHTEHAIFKKQHVVDSFERIGHVEIGKMYPTMQCDMPFGYRNKMEFSFGASRWLTREEIDSGEQFDRSFALGLHVPGRYDKVRDIESCMLQAPQANTVLEHVHAFAKRTMISAYHSKSHEGFARHLVIRKSTTTGSLLVVVITTTPKTDQEKQFIELVLGLYNSLPEGSSVLHAINDTWSPVANGTVVAQHGPGTLQETLLDVHYTISPFSFFQTNTHHVPQLIERALQGAELTQDKIAWDLYCGTGTLSLPAAKRSKYVVGAEMVQSSILDAQLNATANGITNVEFHTLDLHVPKALPVLQSFIQPDVILVDPPRNGMHAQVVQHLLDVAAPRIVYVSCNPATQARDCGLLNDAYSIEEVTPVDMFPQTYHVESVAVLTKR